MWISFAILWKIDMWKLASPFFLTSKPQWKFQWTNHMTQWIKLLLNRQCLALENSSMVMKCDVFQGDQIIHWLKNIQPFICVITIWRVHILIRGQCSLLKCTVQNICKQQSYWNANTIFLIFFFSDLTLLFYVWEIWIWTRVLKICGSLYNSTEFNPSWASMPQQEFLWQAVVFH